MQSSPKDSAQVEANLLPNGGVTYSCLNQMHLTTLVYLTFAALSLVAVVLLYLSGKTKAQINAANNPHFVRFQRQFFAVYFLALFADWLQGPYVYKLYSHYGFAESQIAVIYVVGFGASVVFGTATGPLADRFGRRRTCVAFVVAYSVCCATKLSSSYSVLLFGRVCGGIATSMLFSTFEAWYVYEHVQTHDFPASWISVTFSKSTFWNGILAIVAGVVSNVAAEWLSFGPVAPFMLAIPCLAVCGVLVVSRWPENHGDQRVSVKDSCVAGLREIAADQRVLLLGTVQSLFEAVMYIFVFLWTPILDVAKPPLGLVFSTFMVCIMIGASLYSLLVDAVRMRPARVLAAAVAVNMFCMLVCASATAPSSDVLQQPAQRTWLAFVGFVGLELAVGVYFPAMGYLRSQVIAEGRRAAIMNWFRVPMNVLTCGGLLWLHSGTGSVDNQTVFTTCAALLLVALVACCRFDKIYSEQRALLSDAQDEDKSSAA